MKSLKIKNLKKKFKDISAVNDINLEIKEGKIIGIIGRSGAGKSTLLRMINRLIDPSEGSIEFNDINITSLKGRSLRKWRSECAMIFQQFNLVERLDVLTNVLIGSLGRNYSLLNLIGIFSKEEKINALRNLDRFDLSEKALQKAGTLSGGQQQRVAIARALMQKPKILLADEPISSLDPKNAKRVMDDMMKINREDGITVICNLHSLDVAKKYCDRLIGLSDGKVVFDGTPDDLTAEISKELYDLDNE
ncbi:MAG: phosphonate ABC transporter ATP-binding protein [Alphaproteobacteria bacterium]|jgi:phosphonate transport system ATP-binding protein|nr:phosphonate ABC transporter ATP-binding protein [Alphaproteobacteria bacterium]MBT4910221.1 phosphonate ABC transporter ATP-binding protein [Alphaproteobacteria bacterium]MBT5663532.1 phosphonate ABC transporter ATP-binding protein [Alphaproteobacteria bacterium]